MKHEKQLKYGAILSYLNYAVIILIQLIYVPIMLHYLGQHEYGVYQLVASVITYLSLLNFGFGGSYLRFYSEYSIEGDREKEGNLNGTYLLIFSIFAIVAFVLGLFFSANSNMILGNKLSVNELKLAAVLMKIMAFNIAISFPISVFSSIITSREKFIFQQVVELIKNIANPFLVLPLLMVGLGSIAMVLVSTIVTICGALVNIWYCFFVIKAPFSFEKFDIPLLKRIGKFSFFIFLNSIIDQINWNVDKFIIGRFIGAVSVAIYSVGAQINSMYVQMTDMISSVFAPKVNQIVVARNNVNEQLNNIFNKVGRIQSLIVMLILSGFCLFGKEFIILWAGPEYSEAYIITLVLICPVSIPLCQTLAVDIQRALNMHQFRSIIYTFVAILNVCISIPLTKHFGGIGAATGTAIALVIGNCIIMNIFYHKKMNLNIIKFWKNILSMLPAIIIPVIVALIEKKLLNINNWQMLIVSIFIYVICFNVSVYFMALNDEEKKFIKGR